jgi:hypothetical protein
MRCEQLQVACFGCLVGGEHAFQAQLLRGNGLRCSNARTGFDCAGADSIV